MPCHWSDLFAFLFLAWVLHIWTVWSCFCWIFQGSVLIGVFLGEGILWRLEIGTDYQPPKCALCFSTWWPNQKVLFFCRRNLCRPAVAAISSTITCWFMLQACFLRHFFSKIFQLSFASKMSGSVAEPGMCWLDGVGKPEKMVSDL